MKKYGVLLAFLAVFMVGCVSTRNLDTTITKNQEVITVKGTKAEFPPLSTFIAIMELAKYPVDEVFGKYDRETAEAVKKLVSLSGEDRKAIFAILKRM